MVYCEGKQETEDAAHIEAGGKCSAHTTASVGGRCGKDLEQHDKSEKQGQCAEIVFPGIEETSVGNGLGLSAQQFGNGVVTFAIEGRKDKDGCTQNDRSQEKFPKWLFQFFEDSFEEVYHAGEIERDKSATDTQHKHIGQPAIRKLLCLIDGKLCIATRHNVGNGSCRCR